MFGVVPKCSEAMDPLDACRIIADEEVLKQLAKQQACVNLGTRHIPAPVRLKRW